MNERIKELMNQTGIPTSIPFDQWCEKFAELIVRECIDYAEYSTALDSICTPPAAVHAVLVDSEPSAWEVLCEVEQADIDNIAELVECLRLVLLEHRTFFVIPEKLHDRITAAVTAWEGK